MNGGEIRLEASNLVECEHVEGERKRISRHFDGTWIVWLSYLILVVYARTAVSHMPPSVCIATSHRYL